MSDKITNNTSCYKLGFEPDYVIPKDVYKQAYSGLLKGLMQIYTMTYSNIENFEYIGKAKEALQLMSSRPDIRIILWSSTYNKNKYILQLYKDNINIDAFNRNIQDIQNTDIACFNEKPFFSIGIDNAFGFDPENDWEEVIEALNKNRL